MTKTLFEIELWSKFECQISNRRENQWGLLFGGKIGGVGAKNEEFGGNVLEGFKTLPFLTVDRLSKVDCY